MLAQLQPTLTEQESDPLSPVLIYAGTALSFTQPLVLPGSAVNAMGPLAFFGQDLQAAPVNALFDNSRVPL